MLRGVQNGYELPELITPDQYQLIKAHKDWDPVLAGFVGFGCSFGGKWFGGYARNATGTNYALQSKAWLYPYYEGGVLAFKRFPADEVLPFWADADHTILDAAVHIYVVEEYDEGEQAKAVVKVEVMHGGGVDCFIRRDDGTLEPDPDGHSGDYITAEDPDTGKEQGYNWDRIPLVCFKSSHHEIPLL